MGLDKKNGHCFYIFSFMDQIQLLFRSNLAQDLWGFRGGFQNLFDLPMFPAVQNGVRVGCFAPLRQVSCFASKRLAWFGLGKEHIPNEALAGLIYCIVPRP